MGLDRKLNAYIVLLHIPLFTGTAKHFFRNKDPLVINIFEKYLVKLNDCMTLKILRLLLTDYKISLTIIRPLKNLKEDSFDHSLLE